MAYVPDRAIDLMDTIPGAAFKIFVYLCKRADGEGVCFPSLKLIAQDTGMVYSYASEMRAKLIGQGWIESNESGRIQLLTGFKTDSPKAIEVSEKPKDISEKPKHEHSEKPKHVSEKPKSISEKPNFANPVSNISEPAQLTSPINQPMGKPRSRSPARKKNPRSDHPAIQAIREITKRYPSELLFDEIIQTVGDSPDLERLNSCAKAWAKKGYNIFNLAWVTDWYVDGIPTRNGASNNGFSQEKNQQTSKPGKYDHLNK